MSTATAATKPDIDPKAVETIRKEHEAAVTAYWDAVGHARAAGLKLMDVRAILDIHNEKLPRKERIKFGVWVKENCGFTRQTAWNYMTIADRWTDLSRAGVSNLTMRGALRHLRQLDHEAGGGDGKGKGKKAGRRRVRIRQDVWDGVAKKYKVEPDELAKIVKALGIDPAFV